MDDDTELNNRFCLGDETAVRAVYQRYGGAMFAIAMSMLPNRELAAECVQEAFVKAWRASRSFDPAAGAAPMARHDHPPGRGRHLPPRGAHPLRPTCGRRRHRRADCVRAHLGGVRGARRARSAPWRRARGRAPRALRGPHAQRDRRQASGARRDGEVAVVPRPPATGRPVGAPRGSGAVMVVVAQTGWPLRFVPFENRAPRPR